MSETKQENVLYVVPVTNTMIRRFDDLGIHYLPDTYGEYRSIYDDYVRINCTNRNYHNVLVDIDECDELIGLQHGAFELLIENFSVSRSFDDFNCYSKDEDGKDIIIKLTPLLWKRISERNGNRIKVNSWHEHAENTYTYLYDVINVTRKYLYPAVDSNINLYYPHGETLETNAMLPFSIAFWSSPLHCRDDMSAQVKNCPSKLFGYDVVCRQNASIVSVYNSIDGAIVIPLVENGYQWGSLVDMKYLYIHYDIFHGRDDLSNALGIYIEMLKQVLTAINMDEEEVENIKRQNMIRNYANVLLRTDRNILNENIKKTKLISNTIKSLDNDLLAHYNNLYETMSKVEYYQNKLRDIDLSVYEKEFDRLLSLEKINSIDLVQDYMIFSTDLLYCMDPRDGEIFEIGQFEIYLKVFGPNDSDENVVRWKNQTHSIKGYREGMQAPHVFPNGGACLGNMASIFPKLLGKGQIFEAIILAIQFIENVNVSDSAGRHIRKWPHTYKSASECDIPEWDESDNRTIPTEDKGPWDKLSSDEKQKLKAKYLAEKESSEEPEKAQLDRIGMSSDVTEEIEHTDAD